MAAPTPASKKLLFGGVFKKMAPKLAYRNLFHDKLSLIVTLVGIVFSVVLVAVQTGLYLGSERTIAAMMDKAGGDLWIVPLGTKSFDDPVFQIGRERFRALSVPGVESVDDLVVGFGQWRKPAGGTTTVLVIGSGHGPTGLRPWDVIEGSIEALAAPQAVAVDSTYFEDLGITRLGDTAELNAQRVTITAVTKGIRSFTTLPYIFATLNRSRALLDAGPDQATYTIVRLKQGADLEEVRAQLRQRLKNNEILTKDEFRARSVNYWLFQTGAGSALIAGAVLGLIVGVVVVAQTLYASTKDHLNEFATLRALGASSGYIIVVILMQALVSAIIGYTFGIILSLIVVWAAEDSTLTIVMTPGLAASLFAITVGMCAIAAVSAIFKVIRIDPAGVFSR